MNDQVSSTEIQDSRQGLKVFVGNIGNFIDRSDLERFFSPMGEIIHIHINRDSNNHPKGCAIVTFRTTESAQKAITELNGCELKQHVIRVIPFQYQTGPKIEHNPFHHHSRSVHSSGRPPSHRNERRFSDYSDENSSHRSLSKYERQINELEYFIRSDRSSRNDKIKFLNNTIRWANQNLDKLYNTRNEYSYSN